VARSCAPSVLRVAALSGVSVESVIRAAVDSMGGPPVNVDAVRPHVFQWVLELRDGFDAKEWEVDDD